jgi:hypothetical protein
MTLRLLVEALVKYLAGVVMVAAMIFLPAGSLSYWQGWLLMGVLFVPIFVVGVVMMFEALSYSLSAYVQRRVTLSRVVS